jgi:hypothetical protein
MPFDDLTALMFGNTAPDLESVLLGYNPAANSVFGLPLSKVMIRPDQLYGGNPMMKDSDYTDGGLFGGNPAMEAGDYTDGYLSGGDPYVFD